MTSVRVRPVRTAPPRGRGFPEAGALAGNAVFAVLAVLLLVFAWRRASVAVVTPEAETTGDAGMADATIRRDKFGDS